MICKSRRVKTSLFVALLAFCFTLPLFSSSQASAVSTYAAANRFLYAYKETRLGSFDWSDPLRYDTPFYDWLYLYGSQINTYPTASPTGQNVSISGYMNISVADTKKVSGYLAYPDLVPPSGGWVVNCGWGDRTLVTDSYSVTYVKGTWEGKKNSVDTGVTYMNLRFQWTGHFTGSYAVSSGSLLSCVVRGNYTNEGWISVAKSATSYAFSDLGDQEGYISVETSNDSDINAITGVSDAVNQQGDAIREQQQKQYDYLTDTTPPSADTSVLADSAGWLPAGPVDSILTIPITLLNGIINVFSGNQTCSAINLPLPFINSTLPLPCVGSLLNEIGITPLWNIVGGIIGAFLIWDTLKWLYKFVDDTLSMRENNSSMWGGL